ncbi:MULTISPECIES: FxLD family lanthipeptide [Streptomyces]|uniref:FxLD family lantipeptide n=2 Tax=Streptomyces TaxID=1883 RepID=A0A5P8K6X5_9ACTN|nr:MULTISPECIES: FxLD family lanthipeptide [Streptomyces]MDQ0933386.1 FxLD family lantipeptide [Streptomyces turgidiscabies]MDW4910829.1 FxLD family lanthipeptide [Streptomyces sp. ADMS]QFQ98975.1 FxLD family lantipeptide [Streptomyces phaeolivaceus]
MATATTETAPITGDDWQLTIAITDAPVPVAEDCDTSDGCESTCASSCTS